MSGFDDAAVVAEALHVGADAFLGKGAGLRSSAAPFIPGADLWTTLAELLLLRYARVCRWESLAQRLLLIASSIVEENQGRAGNGTLPLPLVGEPNREPSEMYRRFLDSESVWVFDTCERLATALEQEVSRGTRRWTHIATALRRIIAAISELLPSAEHVRQFDLVAERPVAPSSEIREGRLECKSANLPGLVFVLDAGRGQREFAPKCSVRDVVLANLNSACERAWHKARGGPALADSRVVLDS